MASVIKPLEPRVLRQRPQPPRFGGVHPAEKDLPLIDARIGDAGLAAHIGDQNPGLVLLQDPDDCSSAERLRFKLWWSWTEPYFKPN